jgi:hypothetical protein
VIQQLSPSARPHCITPATSYIPKNGTPKELGQVTSVAKQTYSAARSNAFENVDWEMQLPAYQNEEVRHLASIIIYRHFINIS